MKAQPEFGDSENASLRTKSLNRFEDFVVGLADWDWAWWPAVSLRPSVKQDIDNMVLVRMTCIFGPMAGLLSSVMVVLVMHQMTVSLFIFLMMLGCIVFYTICKYTIARYWNRRARRLRALMKVL